MLFSDKLAKQTKHRTELHKLRILCTSEQLRRLIFSTL